ncbi:MAG: hypothetical protein HY823_02635 [Acidobacteria bacterium]|nr:hypothetical protein [Acidobacteriota bacterium]
MRFQAALCLTLPAALAAQAPAPSLSQRYKAEFPGIEALLKEFKSKEALAKAEALIPGARPDYVKGDPRKSLESSQEFNSLMLAYSLAGRAALSSGDWAKARDYFGKAQAVARENHALTTEVVVNPLVETWKKAMEDSRKMLEENAARIKEAEAKAQKDRTPADGETLNAATVWRNNLSNGGKTIQQLQEHAAGLKRDADAFTAPLEGLDKDLKAEEETIQSEKFKGDKAKYVTAVLNTPKNFELPSQADKVKLLYRLTFLDPANARALKSLQAAVEGKDVPVPEEKKVAPAPKKAPAKKKSS